MCMMLQSASARAVASNVGNNGFRALSTESLKVTETKSPETAERIKYFKIYRWDPEQKQKPYLVSSWNQSMSVTTNFRHYCI